MSEYRVWTTPALFLALLMSLIGIGIEAGIALDFHAQPQLSPLAWGLGGAALVFVVGHAVGRKRFDMSHLRLGLMAVGVVFIEPFLILVGVVLAALVIWVLAVLVGELL
jgi:hypothetical protein